VRVLFLTTVAPHARRGGGEICSQAYIDALRGAGHDVTVMAYARPGDPAAPAGTVVVDARSIETDGAPLRELGPWLARAYASGLPYSAAKYVSRAYAEKIERLLAWGGFDLAVIDHAQMGWVAGRLAGRVRRLALVAHNLEHRMYAQRAERSRSPLTQRLYRREARLTERLERRLARTVDEVWCPVADAAGWFSRLPGGAAVRPFTFPPGVKATAATEKRFDVALLGSWTWQPNAQSLRWFVEEVCPGLPAGVRIEVAGKGAGWLDGLHPGLTYRGVVRDACEFMAAARVVAVPSQGGGGLEVKTLDAIACGARVVATPAALRGIDDPPESVAVAETPDEFAGRILRALGAGPEPAREGIAWAERRRASFQAEVGEVLTA
jgi:hypothetical protein